MIKKILALLIVLLCVSCSTNNNNNTEIQINTEEYIDPVKNIFIFDEIDKSLQNTIKKANNDNEFKNKQFKMLFKDIYDKDLVDINQNTINLKDYDKLFVEVVSVNCSHCKKQVSLIEEFSSIEDVQFIQYFNVGNKEEILNFYEEANVSIPDNLIIIESDNNFKDYLLDTLEIEVYPTLLSFNKGILQFNCGGEVDLDTYELINDISFNNILKPEDFIDENGNNIIEKDRTIEDVEASLSAENKAKLLSLNEESKFMTLKNISTEFNYDNIAKANNDISINEIDDFNYYKDKKTIFIYTYLKDENDLERVNFINELIDEEYEYIVVLVDGFESSSSMYKKMDIKFNCPVISLTSKVPQDLFKVEMNYPGALFVDRGIISGVYSNIENKDKFNDALEMFLSDNSIAYKRNN